MPRLRLRVASTGATFRLDLPQDCTWSGLQAEARRVAGVPADDGVALSLNKKVPLDGAPDAPLSALGVCNGDLVWLLSPQASQSQPQAAVRPTGAASPPTTAHSEPTALPTARSPAAAAAPADAAAQGGGAIPALRPQPQLQNAPRRAAAPAAAPAGGANASPGGGGASPGSPACADGDPTDGAGGGGGSDGTGGGHGAGGGVRAMDSSAGAVSAGADAEAGAEDVGDVGDAGGDASSRGLRGVSVKLRRLLAPGTAAGGAAAGDGSSSSAWASLPATSRCLLVLDCAMAEAGFEGMQDLPALAARGAALHRQLLYGCSYVTASCTSGSDPAAAAGAAAAAAAAAAAGGGEDATLSEAVDGNTAVTAAAPPQPVGKLLWYGMGRYLVVHGVLCISGGAATAAASPLSPTISLHIDLSEYGAGGTAAQSTGPGPPPELSPPSPSQQLLLPSDPAGHWRRLKDELVLPLLAAACRAAGTPPPLGLTVLPLELQLAVLRKLQARDLAALSCVCTALHSLASEDELWRPQCDSEFGQLPAADVALANTRGFKYVYGRKWRERAERRKRCRQMFTPPPLWYPPPPAPFIRPPFLPPGSIGGDYDRLPPVLLGSGGGGAFGPPALLGAGRGLFGGRGGVGGSGGLGGSFPGLGRRPGPMGGGGTGGWLS